MHIRFIITMDWIEQGLTSHSTHCRSFRRRCGDCSISQDCSPSQSPQCVRCWVVCVQPLLITMACMCIVWKALCSYVLDAQLGLWVLYSRQRCTSVCVGVCVCMCVHICTGAITRWGDTTAVHETTTVQGVVVWYRQRTDQATQVSPVEWQRTQVSVCLSPFLSVCLLVCLCPCLSVCLSVSVSLCLSVCPSVCLSPCLSDCLPGCLIISLIITLKCASLWFTWRYICHVI